LISVFYLRAFCALVGCYNSQTFEQLRGIQLFIISNVYRRPHVAVRPQVVHPWFRCILAACFSAVLFSMLQNNATFSFLSSAWIGGNTAVSSTDLFFEVRPMSDCFIYYGTYCL